jgi:SAM-dependent methyltransferase
MTDADYWDGEAPTFDAEPDHGLRDPAVRAAWQRLLLPLLPPDAVVADLGCGTGTLAVLLAEAGHRVVGVDLAPRMLEVARAKAAAAGVAAELLLGDAADPPLAAGSVDVVLCRHVLWALPDPTEALRRWVSLLKPEGRLVLVEGRWGTGSGLPATRTRDLVLQHRSEAVVERLDDPLLWGRPVDDERYLVVSAR